MAGFFALIFFLVFMLVCSVDARKKPKPRSGVASFTYYTSYAACCPDNPNYDPNANTEECDDYSACEYSGDFAAIGHKSYKYVQTHNLVAFYDNSDPKGKKFNKKYGGKTIELKKGDVIFNATIADTCGNKDCNNCCAHNSKPSGFLVDVEYWTAMNNFGTTDSVEGEVEFKIFK
jgi:hypothetical protein